MARPMRGVIAVEGVQTGDGRVIAEGACTWVDPPLPLGWLQQEQHGDLLDGAVQVGTIDTLTRVGQNIEWTGTLDDEQPDGAEVARRLDAGTAPLGNRFGISIDPDDYELQVVSTEQEQEGIVIVASGGVLPSPVLTAAAGDADPGDGGGPDGDVLFEDAVDSVLFRFTRLRIRGATLCAIAAFDGAYGELAGDAPATDTAPADDTAPAEAVTAATTVELPPVDWFHMNEDDVDARFLVEQPDGSMAVPLQITDDGHVFGHLARWGQCHTGYPGACVSPPESMRAYADFMVGETRCADGTTVATGVLTVGCDHAAAQLLAAEARDHYAHTGLGWSDVRVSNGLIGPWVSGALRPGMTPDIVRVLRASALSGDWRRIGGNLELIAALSVNSPGFPIVREAVVASADHRVEVREAVMASAGMADGAQVSLVAAGLVQRCADCADRARADRDLRTGVELADESIRLMRLVTDQLGVIERRTRHLTVTAAATKLERIRV